MKLKDYVKEIDDNTTIFVGANNGSGFVFAAPKKIFNEDIKRINDGVKNRLNIFIDTTKNYRRVCEDRANNVIDVIHSDLSDSEKQRRIENEIFYLKNSLYRLDNYYPKLFNYEKALKDFVPIEEREVLESYNRLSDEGLVIIVDGCDSGSYWFAEEYLNERIFYKEA